MSILITGGLCIVLVLATKLIVAACKKDWSTFGTDFKKAWTKEDDDISSWVIVPKKKSNG